MEAYEAILTRRSIREYADRAVPEDLVKQLLVAAMNAFITTGGKGGTLVAHR